MTEEPTRRIRTDPLIGTDLGGFVVEAEIGRGGMGAVYLAHQRRPEREVAIKVLPGGLAHDETFRQRFILESDLAARVGHPNIIPIYAAGEVDGLLYLAMKFVQGWDLRTLLKQAGHLELPRTIRIVEQVAAALDRAHARGLVHRDVKPGNILIADGTGDEPPDHVYLSDFGLTKQASAPSGLTLSGQLLGTPDYMAPEQIEGGDADGRLDVYALGCVLYECLAGKPPFRKDFESAILLAHIREAPPRLSQMRPDMPPGLDDVIATALAKQPQARYQTCAVMVDAVREVAKAAEELAAKEAAATAAREAAERMARQAAEDEAVRTAAERAAKETERERRAQARHGAASRVPRRWLALPAGAVAIAVFGFVAVTLVTRPPSDPSTSLHPHVPAAIWSTCDPSDVAAATTGAVASVECEPGHGIEVGYVLFETLQDMESQYGASLAAHGIAHNSGPCRIDDFGEAAYPSEGVAPGGRLMCYRDDDGEPWLEWTAPALRIWAYANAPQGVRSQLYYFSINEAGPVSSSALPGPAARRQQA